MSQTPIRRRRRRRRRPGRRRRGRPTATAADAVERRSEHQRLKAERDKLMYAVARRPTSEHRASASRAETDQRVQYANQSLIKSLLPVIDNFERALARRPAQDRRGHHPQGHADRPRPVAERARSSSRSRRSTPSPATPFDPTRHEALMQQDDPQRSRPARSPRLLQKGYALHDRTLRPAQVVTRRRSRRRPSLSDRDFTTALCPLTNTSATPAATRSSSSSRSRPRRSRSAPSAARRRSRRLIGTGAGLIFKGSGFYITDYRDDELQGQGAKADSAAATATAATSKPARRSRPRRRRRRRQARGASKSDAEAESAESSKPKSPTAKASRSTAARSR